MYSSESISLLTNRIGWGELLNSEVTIVVSEDNLTATSLRKVNAFHSLASVENIYSAVAEPDMEDALFNEFLASMRAQAVMEIMTAILDQHHLYDETIDYSSVITAKVKIFDDAIGYCIAIKALELFISTGRKNLTERNASLNFQTLKVELEGAKNDKGFTIAKGIILKKELAIQKAQRILFPDEILINGDPIW